MQKIPKNLDGPVLGDYAKTMLHAPATDTQLAPYDALRDGLIWGRWRSGERLKPEHLKDELGCTKAALREALLRLAGEGLVEAEKHLGFRAVEHSANMFRQAAHMRELLECEGAKLALERGDFDWEMALNAAHHNLAYIEEQMDGQADITPFLKRWSRQDWVFHETLLSACGSDLLLRNYKAAYDVFRMYAVSQMSRFGFSELTRFEHKDIYTAAIARDVPTCLAAIRVHLKRYEDKRPPARQASNGETT